MHDIDPREVAVRALRGTGDRSELAMSVVHWMSVMTPDEARWLSGVIAAGVTHLEQQHAASQPAATFTTADGQAW